MKSKCPERRKHGAAESPACRSRGRRGPPESLTHDDRPFWVPVPRPPRPPAVRAPSRTPPIPRGRLALRGDRGDLHPPRADDGSAAPRWRAIPADDDDVSALVRDAGRSAAEGPVSAP